jgi:hypothetical protein
MTKAIIDIATPLGISVHDHIIVGKNGHASLKGVEADVKAFADRSAATKFAPLGPDRCQTSRPPLAPSSDARNIIGPPHREETGAPR